jgi:hypothetical protein
MLPAAIKEEIFPMDTSADAPVQPPRERGFYVNQGIPVTAEVRAIPAKIMARLTASRVPLVMEAVQRLRAGKLKIGLYGKGQKHRDPARRTHDTTRWDGYWVSTTADTIWLNLDKLLRGPGAVNDLWAASVIVHETIHAFGGNELAAFFGQAQFVLESGEWWRIPSRTIRTFYFTYLKGQLNDAVYAIGAKGDPNAPGGIMGYAAKHAGWLDSRPPSPWRIKQGGWARALNVPHPGFDAAIANPDAVRAIFTPP